MAILLIMLAILLIMLAILVVVLALGLYNKNTNAICKSGKRLEGRVVVVTGGTAGIGLEISTDLAKRGAKVYIACPFEEEGVNARKTIIDQTSNNKVIFKLLDLASLKSVRQFADQILKTEERLDILINNAGVGVPVDNKSYYGTNYIMQVNYFGHFLLTLLLLPLLKKSGTKSEPSRIINISSFMHWFGVVDYEWRKSQHFVYRNRSYCNSKYCFVPFTYELSKRLKGTNVVVNAVDPGAVGTEILKKSNVILGTISAWFFCKFFKNTWEGAQTALHVALDKDAGDVTGKYFRNCHLARTRKSAYDDELAEKLWQDSVKLVQLDKDELVELNVNNNVTSCVKVSFNH